MRVPKVPGRDSRNRDAREKHVKLEGKVVIVTGASYGIGRAYAHALAAEGATVIAAARSLGTVDNGVPQKDTLAETVETGKNFPGSIHAKACDVLVEEDVIRLVEETIAEFGRVDVLVNNAAIYTHHDTFAIDIPTFDQHVNVNIRGPYLTMREVSRQMKKQGSGSIVNITSAVARHTEKGFGGHDDMMLYCVTKAGLNRMTDFFAEELREYGVAVNGLSPGAVDTVTWNTVDPETVANFKEQGLVSPCTPEALGAPLISLAQHTAATLTGQMLHIAEHGKSWN
ncbi:MAG: SDR family oxidoreductase [Novosphingobium sp.]|nr:SDR family oxidoreductase [Novosphingobium sp.]